MAGMKRQRENEKGESLDLSMSLMLLSQPQGSSSPLLFECKTCNRQFSSFQALGGHRASHKKTKVEDKEGEEGDRKADLASKNKKGRMHECSICGQEFSLGQALGGHMRKHRAAMNEGLPSINEVAAKVPVLKRSNSTRVMCLDLNLTPLENQFNLLFRHKPPPPPLNLSLC